jgi:hypothetical protein
MDRFALFVDGGYLAAAAASALFGTPKRHLIRLDLGRMREDLMELGAELARPASVLRLYWYDACVGGVPSGWHHRLADMPDVKLRLGELRGTPARQKGVDTLLVHDLLVLAQERSITDAILFTGDEDMREAGPTRRSEVCGFTSSSPLRRRPRGPFDRRPIPCSS